jgi:hypothetical protein
MLQTGNTPVDQLFDGLDVPSTDLRRECQAKAVKKRRRLCGVHHRVELFIVAPLGELVGGTFRLNLQRVQLNQKRTNVGFDTIPPTRRNTLHTINVVTRHCAGVFLENFGVRSVP